MNLPCLAAQLSVLVNSHGAFAREHPFGTGKDKLNVAQNYYKARHEDGKNPLPEATQVQLLLGFHHKLLSIRGARKKLTLTAIGTPAKSPI